MPNWSSGDAVFMSGDFRYRVVSVIPLKRIAEFIDER